MSAFRWLQKDHLGVVVALFGTYVSFIAEAFGCAPQWCALHLTATVCLFSGILLFSAQFNRLGYCGNINKKVNKQLKVSKQLKVNKCSTATPRRGSSSTSSSTSPSTRPSSSRTGSG